LTDHDVSGLGPVDVHVWTIELDAPDKPRRRELAHAAERQILARYLDVRPASLEFGREPSGKPLLVSDQLQFNLSHSGGVALLAVSRTLAVGIDVQEPHEAVTRPWFAKRICSLREYEQIAALTDRSAALLRLWVRKEAVVKARGEGSYVSVDGLDVWDDQVQGGWLCRDLELPALDGYRAAVVTRDVPGITITTRSF